MHYARISGTGGYLPERVVTNDELAKQVETSHDWIVERTGIHKRHIAADNETASSMGTEAARRAIASANIDPNDIDMIIGATCSAERMFPSIACYIQRALGIKRPIPAFDVTVACAGFIYAASIAEQYIKTGTFKNVLIVGSEMMSRVIDWTDRRTCILFGDGAGAWVLSQSDEPGIHSCVLHANAEQSEILYLPNSHGDIERIEANGGKVVMRGNEVFKQAVIALRDIVTETLDAANLTASDIDWLVPHQANYRIIKMVADRLDLPEDRVVMTIADHANTSSASIPLALDEAVRDGRIKRGQRLLCEAFGGGLAWGSVLVTY